MNREKPIHPGWLKLSIRTDPVLLEPLNAFLFEIGCTGTVSGEPDDQALVAYVERTAGLEVTRQRVESFLDELKGIFPEIERPELEISPIEQEDWNGKWKSFFKPREVTPDLLILPVWETEPDGYRKRIIRMDPGPAFGTGQHPTTSMCLRAMETIRKAGKWTMLDVGTGSGILAIYGAMLGASVVKAIDIDPEALRWAHQNISINRMEGSIDISPQVLEEIREVFDLVAANLILGTIEEEFHHLFRLTAPRGHIILSGILRDQEKRVQDICRGYNIKRLGHLHEQEWACLILGR
jgi:ribosomal protein L11 methyltransferase